MSEAVTPELQRSLEELYAAFDARDVPTVLAAMTADVEWPNGWEGGVLNGQDEVRDFWTRQWSQIDPSVTPTGFRLEPEGGVAVVVHRVVRDGEGAVVSDGDVTHVHRFRADLVRSMEIRG